jgi:hypothetical protein
MCRLVTRDFFLEGLTTQRRPQEKIEDSKRRPTLQKAVQREKRYVSIEEEKGKGWTARRDGTVLVLSIGPGLEG